MHDGKRFGRSIGWLGVLLVLVMMAGDDGWDFGTAALADL